MFKKDKLFEIFSVTLGIEVGLVTESLEYNSIPNWDSTGHMIVIAALEDEFDVMLDTDDIIDMSSVSKAIDILSKYGISFG